MLPKEITREIFEQQLRDRILSRYKNDNQRRIREYILEVSEKINSVQKKKTTDMTNDSGRVSIDYDRIEQAKLFQKWHKSKIKEIESKLNDDWLKSRDHIVVKLPEDVQQSFFGKNIFEDKTIQIEDSYQNIPE